MPEWMQWISKISPATYVLRGDRASVLSGAGSRVGGRLAALIIAVLATPIGLAIFHRGERYAKKHGKLKRAG